MIITNYHICNHKTLIVVCVNCIYEFHLISCCFNQFPGYKQLKRSIYIYIYGWYLKKRSVNEFFSSVLCECVCVYIYISEPIYPARAYSSMSFCLCICRLDGGGGWFLVEKRSVIWLGSDFRQRFCICLITTYVHFNPKTSKFKSVRERERTDRRHF